METERAIVEKRYISTIRICGKDRNPIPAGTPFCESDINPHTFETLNIQNLIEVYAPGENTPIVTPLKDRKIRTGPINVTPEAALRPPAKTARQPENLDEAGEAERQAIRTVLKERFGIKTMHNERLDTVTRKLASAEATAGVVKDVVAAPPASKVWAEDPERLANIPFEQLSTAYKATCTQYNLPIESLTTRKELIEKLCSQRDK